MALDLAWSARNLTGGAVLVDGVLREARGDLISDADDRAVGVGEQWLDRVNPSGDMRLDAPSCVCRISQEGKRLRTRLGRKRARYHAGPYYGQP